MSWGKCRSCDAAIYWAKSSRGKNMPMEEDDQGDFEVGDDGVARKVLSGTGGWTCHFVTCPQADNHRKPRKQVRHIEECPKCGHKFVGKGHRA